MKQKKRLKCKPSIQFSRRILESHFEVNRFLNAAMVSKACTTDYTVCGRAIQLLPAILYLTLSGRAVNLARSWKKKKTRAHLKVGSKNSLGK